MLSDANKEHGPRLSLGRCWLVHLSLWLSSALCLDGAPSEAFSLLRERLRKGSPQPNYSLLTQRQARVHLLPSHPALLHRGPWATLIAEQAVWTLDVCGVSLVTPLLAQAVSPPSDAWNQISGYHRPLQWELPVLARSSKPRSRDSQAASWPWPRAFLRDHGRQGPRGFLSRALSSVSSGFREGLPVEM